MQALISLPRIPDMGGEWAARGWLFGKVAGVPLLARVVGTAIHSGCHSVLLLHPPGLPAEWLERVLDHRAVSSVRVETVSFPTAFDPGNPSHWRQINRKLEARFLWLPWNFVPDQQWLRQLVEKGERSGTSVRFAGPGQPAFWDMPAVIVASETVADGVSPGTAEAAAAELLKIPEPAGWAVTSRKRARMVERELVRHLGKAWDVIYSRFNRGLCRPLVRWLSNTPVSPNTVTFVGLPMAILSGYWFAQGHWSAYVIGAFFYFATVLIDEIDGMLARLTFRESTFGCWLESFVDYATYIPVFGGMAIGLYRQYGQPWAAVGLALLFGTVMIFAVAIYHRRLASRSVRAGKYVPEYYRVLEADSGSLISRFVRHTHFFTKKAALCHFVLIFSLLDLLPVFFGLAAIGSNVAWIVGLYTSRLLGRDGTRKGAQSCAR